MGPLRLFPSSFSSYTLHALHNGYVIPVIFALLPNKTKATYDHFFAALKSLGAFNPRTMMIDFEHGTINAFSAAFPNCQMRGCQFHLGQAVWRHIQADRELRDRYINEADVALKVRKLLALSHLPVRDVIQAYEDLQETEFYRQNERLLENLLTYFEMNWIGVRGRRQGERRNPGFPLPHWNCHDAVMEGLPKTNNAVEGWHSRFANLVEAHHPTIWKFINCLNKEQSSVKLDVGRCNAGIPPAQSRRKYRECAERIRAATEKYDRGEKGVDEYLNEIAHNIEMNV